MEESFLDRLYKAHQTCENCPKSEDIASFFNGLLGLLFPNFASMPISGIDRLKDGFRHQEDKLTAILKGMSSTASKAVAVSFFDALPRLYDLMQQDVQATFEGDPAARSREEVIRSYPGFYAIAAYRIAHELLRLNVESIPRSITEYAHSRTGIDIHPAAVIGRHFCIDHGTGVVIGETTRIGDHVKLYQGVTLGALSVDKKDAQTKRHPTIEDGVIIYAGATILGGETVIGHSSIIGGNVWLTKSVPPHSKVYYKASMHQEGETPDLIIVK